MSDTRFYNTRVMVRQQCFFARISGSNASKLLFCLNRYVRHRKKNIRYGSQRTENTPLKNGLYKKNR